MCRRNPSPWQAKHTHSAEKKTDSYSIFAIAIVFPKVGRDGSQMEGPI